MSDEDVTRNAQPETVPSESVEPTDSQPEPRPAAADLEVPLRRAIRDEFDEVVPHLVAALKRNEAFDELVTRLDKAEKRLAERERRPLVSGLVRLLHRIRRTEFDAQVKDSLVEELEALLGGAGYEEFGDVGEPFDAVRHEAIEGTVDGGRAVVREIYEQGLETLGEVVVRASVRVGSDNDESESEK